MRFTLKETDSVTASHLADVVAAVADLGRAASVGRVARVEEGVVLRERVPASCRDCNKGLILIGTNTVLG